MFNVILYQPEIPPNTGNIIRLCANTSCSLHLIEPLGFKLEDKQLRRAGLDYHEYADVKTYPSWSDCLAQLDASRIFTLTTKGSNILNEVRFLPQDSFVFGPETRGLPMEILQQFPAEQRLRLPMAPNSRSLNLSNSVAITVFEAWRQNGFLGGS